MRACVCAGVCVRARASVWQPLCASVCARYGGHVLMEESMGTSLRVGVEMGESF